ncbi:NAD(P)H-binding protein [Lentilactobacillus senioris]|uniref:NAD(P)H-binding protein n=1 Tax=Lentilactobacillus senioris TaxID=931534 RepID=UPI00228205C5|nr:NAD(P)H-binding protein [Lentilactobacillus senioris]MCY9805981.1 NAD(P)H-binding protein [Lentilactobacillus senioris]
MTKLLIIGARKSVPQAVTANVLAESEAEITLFDHSLNVEDVTNEMRERVITGEISDEPLLASAMRDQDVVFMVANDNTQVATVMAQMKSAEVERLILVLPKESDDEATINDAVENSGLNYTILRPDWLPLDVASFTEIQHQIAHVATQIVQDPQNYQTESMEIN